MVFRLNPSNIYIFSNGNASEMKANESFDNGVFFDIEAKRTPSIFSFLHLLVLRADLHFKYFTRKKIEGVKNYGMRGYFVKTPLPLQFS